MKTINEMLTGTFPANHDIEYDPEKMAQIRKAVLGIPSDKRPKIATDIKGIFKSGKTHANKEYLNG